jgi:DNA helicase-2/ATP-dependent DNA helicase PcrA
MDQALYDALFEWRADKAAEESMPAFVIFTDATLTAIAEARPTDERELLRITGIGRTKLSKYGESVLNICTR